MDAAVGRIERASAQDIGAMLEFWRNIPGLGDDTEASLRIFLERNPSACLVLKMRERLIGTVLGGFDGRRGYIYHLAVHPEYQGRGYGKALFNSVICELKVLGAAKIHLFVFNNNYKAVSFYQGQGGKQRQDIQVFSWVF